MQVSYFVRSRCHTKCAVGCLRHAAWNLGWRTNSAVVHVIKNSTCLNVLKFCCSSEETNNEVKALVWPSNHRKGHFIVLSRIRWCRNSITDFAEVLVRSLDAGYVRNVSSLHVLKTDSVVFNGILFNLQEAWPLGILQSPMFQLNFSSVSIETANKGKVTLS